MGEKERAGRGNRTPVTSLEGWLSTIEIYPRERGPSASLSETGYSWWVPRPAYPISAGLGITFRPPIPYAVVPR